MALIRYVEDGIYQEALGSNQAANLLRILFHSPLWAAEVVRLAKVQMTQLKLSPAARELVILHTSRLIHSEYVWAQHEGISAVCGVSKQQRDALHQGSLDASAFSEGERLLLRFISHAASFKTPNLDEIVQLQQHFSEQELVEAIGLHGFAYMIGRLTSAFNAEVDPISGADMLQFVAAVT